MAKRITVAITVDDYPSRAQGAIRRAMINAGVAAATQEQAEISAIEARVGTPHKAKS